MFNLAFELGASISIQNAQQLTPLSLAAKLTYTEVRIANKEEGLHVNGKLRKTKL